jgi:hypothetical protein
MVRGEPRTIPGLVSPEADVGFTKDLWTKKATGPDGKVTRPRTARYGKGKRWLAVSHDEHGRERSKSFPVKAPLPVLRVNYLRNAW